MSGWKTETIEVSHCQKQLKDWQERRKIPVSWCCYSHGPVARLMLYYVLEEVFPVVWIVCSFVVCPPINLRRLETVYPEMEFFASPIC